MPSNAATEGNKRNKDVASRRGRRKKSNRQNDRRRKAEEKTSTAQTKPGRSRNSNTTCKPLRVDEETRWKPTSVFRRPGTTADEKEECNEDVHDARLVRWLLNKVTPSNFDKVVAVFASEYATIPPNEKRSRKAIEAILDRAAMDTRYAATYAQICGRLTQDLLILATTEDDDEDEDGSPNDSIVQATANNLESLQSSSENDDPIAFGNVLLRICQEEIRQSTQTVTDRCQNEGPGVTRVVRRRYVGAKRFIGELYNHHVLEAKEVISYLNSLLDQVAGSTAVLDELALEGFCVLLDTCGKLLDESTLSESQTEDLQRCWEVLKGLVGSPLPSFRARSMGLDLLELRQKTNWHPVRYGARQRKEMVPRAMFVDVSAPVYSRGRQKNSKGKTVHFDTTKSSSSRTE